MQAAYTLGHKNSYDKGLNLYGKEFKKLGKTEEDDYPGGSVWKTFEEAESCIVKNGFDDYAVYILELPNGWDVDVSKEVDEEGMHHLLTTAVILCRVYKE